jgi:hypothetical protein
MPTMSLKVTRPPSSAADHRPPELVKPLFRGNGDTDYLCGNCGSVMAAGLGPSQRVIVDGCVLRVRGGKRVPGSLASMTLWQAQWEQFTIELRGNAEDTPPRRGDLPCNSG